ncbi:hypothetical protein P153DRAFT_376709 [Dothidotthia symphoricarpi CBS 119687]|uniref:GPI anchored protein n=1 Tax=Dothidotthia symphoricarpi CBS 119687 TaxID=1392245 RepID=A0A6A6ACJ6_9PLEO|nr:uncharacterized protein P153DRAFT_376709 [Dothidotthia symphoricarpi CBS 119687]KAF2128597.1 hypothetical protein P153DRAFT_376709 [Dothidotthia symphoricarpi CBS 119687]
MLYQKLAVIAAITAAAAAQDVSQDDIPSQCTAICAEVVTISTQCDQQNENDTAELQCVCNATNANTLIPACEACVAQFDVDNDDDDNVRDNDVYEVLTRCNFSTTTYNAASASSLASSIATSMNSAASASSSASGAVITSTSGTVLVTASVTPASTAAQGAGNAAPAPTAAAAIGLGALGLAFGML